jgi:hypothetical protein
MKIYIAGFYLAGRSRGEAGTVYAQASGLSDPAHCLESFHYIGNDRTVLRLIEEDKRKVFLDSGAFSMFTQGVKVDLKQYARFIYRMQPIIEVTSNLDAIGEGKEQLSYDNQKQLESWLKPQGIEVQPVHHVRDRDHWLQRYLDEGYDYIFLGGMVPENTATLRVWLDHVWHHYLTNPDGSPKVKVHGFGLTTLELMFRYPWYSVDSTSWVLASRFGGIYLDFPQPDGSVKDFKVDFSARSSKQRDINSWHYNSLDKFTQQKVLRRVAELEAERIKHPEIEARLEKYGGFKQGYCLEGLAQSYGWRDHFNINYFRRSQDRHVKTFKRTQETLFT